MVGNTSNGARKTNKVLSQGTVKELHLYIACFFPFDELSEGLQYPTYCKLNMKQVKHPLRVLGQGAQTSILLKNLGPSVQWVCRSNTLTRPMGLP